MNIFTDVITLCYYACFTFSFIGSIAWLFFISIGSVLYCRLSANGKKKTK